MKVYGDGHLEGLVCCHAIRCKSAAFWATFWEYWHRWVLYSEQVYKLGCGAVMKVNDNGHLEGARSLSRYLMQICIIWGHFLGTLAQMGPLQWVGIQTWLRNSHEGKWQWPPRGGSCVVTLFAANLHHFGPLFGNTGRDGSYTLGRCKNLAAEQP